MKRKRGRKRRKPKTLLHSFLVIAAFLVLLVFLLKSSRTSSDQDIFSFIDRFQPEVYGEGEVEIRFDVKVPSWTPSEDRIFLYVKDYIYGDHGGIPMKMKSPGQWSVILRRESGGTVEYKYNRNDYGYASDEEFTPDSPLTWRSVEVKKSKKIKDSVNKWRWLSEEYPEIVHSKFVPQKVERDKPFILGVFMLDFFQNRFEERISSTFDRLQENGFKYVGITYTPSIFTNVEPLTFSHEDIDTYSRKQLEYTFAEAKKRDLEIILAARIGTYPKDPSKFEDMDDEKHQDGWYRLLVNEWLDVMVDTASFAERNDVAIFMPMNQWSFWGDQSEEQKELLNDLINDAYDRIHAVFRGTLATDSYYEGYDFYSNLDMIGDRWGWSLTDKSEPSVEEMRAGAETILEKHYLPIFEKYNKPIFLSKINYASYDGAAGANNADVKVVDWLPDNEEFPLDFQEQADAYEAVFQAIYDETWIGGAAASSYNYWNSLDKSESIRGKPAEEVWSRWSGFLS